jgi:hypothetical protein
MGYQVGPLGGKWRLSVRKVGECGMESWPFKAIAQPVSIKDRWVGPHEQVLNVPIACWWYVPSKPSSWSSTEAWLKPTALLVGLREKLGMDQRIGQPVCFGLCQKPFFSGAVGSVQIYRRLVKGCHVLTAWDTYSLGPYADWAWDTCGVLVGFSPTWCTSIQIPMTLGYE